MRKLVLIACLAAAAVWPAAARADGIAFAGVAHMGSGVASADERFRYVTLPLEERTVLTKIDAVGAIVGYRPLAGAWGIPMVAFDGSTGGLSADGRTLVLAQPPIGRMHEVSRFPVIRTKTLRRIATVTLRGSFSFDAVSPDGKTLYVIEHVNRRDVAEYQVRAYDIPGERLLPYPIRDHSSNEAEMYGFPRSRATSPDGRWAYTLYEGGHHSFVHALDTVARTAVCVDLPMDTPPEHVADARLVPGAGGGTLAVESPTAGTVAIVDTKTLTLRPEPADTPAVLAGPPAPAPAPTEQPVPAGWRIGTLLAGAIALAAAALGLRRLRRVRRSALDEPGLVLAPLEGAPRDELDLGLNDEDGAQALADLLGQAAGRAGVAGELDGHREGRLLLHAGRGGPHTDVAAHRGREAADDLADRAREDVHAADDQHVVGAPDAADPRARAPAGTRRRLDDDVVAGAEAQKRSGALA